MTANEIAAKQWFLYGNDLDLARQELGRKIQSAGENPTGYQQQLNLISLLTYIGAYDDCESWLERVQGRNKLVGQQSTYRILRRWGEPNPWRGLLGGQRQQQLEQAIEQRFAKGLPVTVDLVGGIGDQLETAALMQASRPGLPRPEALWLRPTGENSSVVQALLEEVPGRRLATAASSVRGGACEKALGANSGSAPFASSPAPLMAWGRVIARGP